MGRALAFGMTCAGALLWLTFFAGPGMVEGATLAAAAFALWWFATVEAGRLVDEAGRPQVVLFGLAAVGCGVLVTAAALLASATTFLILAVGVAAIVTGFARAVRHGLASPPLEE